MLSEQAKEDGMKFPMVWTFYASFVEHEFFYFIHLKSCSPKFRIQHKVQDKKIIFTGDWGMH